MIGAMIWGIGVTTNAQELTMSINHKIVQSEVSAEIKENITYVPLSFVAKQLGAKVEWESPDVFITKGNTDIKCTIGTYAAIVNNKEVLIEAKPYLVNGRTMVPLRFISEALGAKVEYDKDKSQISIELLNDTSGTVGEKLVEHRGNSVSNIRNGGRLDSDGEWLYYANPSQEWKLYRAKANFTEKMAVNQDVYTNNISIVDDSIYCEIGRDGKGYYIRMDKDGGNQILLGTTIYWPTLVGDWIYYMSWAPQEGYLHRMRPDGSEKTQLVQDSINSFVTDGKYVYYVQSNAKIFRLDLETGERTKILASGTGRLELYKDELYFTFLPDQKFYKMSVSGGDLTLISDMELWEFNLDHRTDWIYVVNKDDNQTLYRMKIDGTQVEKLNNVKTSGIHIIGERVYYTNLYTNTIESLAINK